AGGLRGVRIPGATRAVLGQPGRHGVRRLRRARCRRCLRTGGQVAGRPGEGGAPGGRRHDPARGGPQGSPGNALWVLRIPPGAPYAQLQPAGPAASTRAQPVSYLSDLDLSALPRHVAIVMDGNGRWAKQRGLPRTEGHCAGEEALYDVVDGAIGIGLEWLTVFAFSTENWKRPAQEVRFLMNYNRRMLWKRRDELHRRNVRIRYVGRVDWRVPRTVLKEMDYASELTSRNTGLTFTVAFNYGGRTEITDAVRRLVADHDRGRLKGEGITPGSISARVYHPA